MADAPNTESKTPEWLEKLQQESWQAEILISGGSLIGILGLINNGNIFYSILSYSTHIEESYLGVLYLIFLLPLIFLAEGFFIHLLLRGYWIALIGVNYVYPAGINTEKLALKGKFSNLIREANNVPYLVKLDKLCGIVFAFTFFVIFSFIGFVLFLVPIQLLDALPLKNFPEVVVQIKEIAILLLTLFGVLSFIDFFTMGLLKRAKWFSWIYYPIHFVNSIFTLSVLYRRLYYTIVSNVRRWHILLAFVVQVVLAFVFLSSGSRLSRDISPIGSANELNFLEVREHVVTGKSLEFYVMHQPRLESQLFEEWKAGKPDAHEKSFEDLKPETKLSLITGAYDIFVDTSRVTQLSWMLKQKNYFKFQTTQLVSLINVSGLSPGSHQLQVRVRKIKQEARREAVNVKVESDFTGRVYFYVDR